MLACALAPPLSIISAPRKGVGPTVLRPPIDDPMGTNFFYSLKASVDLIHLLYTPVIQVLRFFMRAFHHSRFMNSIDFRLGDTIVRCCSTSSASTASFPLPLPPPLHALLSLHLCDLFISRGPTPLLLFFPAIRYIFVFSVYSPSLHANARGAAMNVLFSPRATHYLTFTLKLFADIRTKKNSC